MDRAVKPSISIDERGVLLHVTDSEGRGFAVPLDTQTVLELGAKLAAAKAMLLTPEGKRRFAKGLAQLLLSMTEPEKKDDG